MKKQRTVAMIMAVIMSISSLSMSAFANESIIVDDVSAVIEDIVTTSATIDAAETNTDGSSDLESGDDYQAMAVLDGWAIGQTESNSKNTVTGDYKKGSVTFAASTSGKWSATVDQMTYYYIESGLSTEDDFTLSATMTIDDLNNIGSNPQQSSAGLIIADKIGVDTPNSVAGSIYTAKSAATTSTIGASYRVGTARTQVSNVLSSDFPSSGKNVATLDLKITKSGDMYTIVCGANSETIQYSSFSDGNVYPALFAARAAGVTFTDIKLETVDFKPAEIFVKTPPVNNTAVYGNELDLSGMELEVTYRDDNGAEYKEVMTEGYTVLGFDPNVMGIQTVQICVGNAVVDYQVEVVAKVATKITVVTPPVKTEYYEGQTWNLTNLKVKAEYDDGDPAELEKDEYELYVDGKLIADDTYFTYDMRGDKDVVVKHKNTEYVSAGNASDKFKINISDQRMTSITLAGIPVKSMYFEGDELNTNGLSIMARYNGASGYSSDILQDSEFTVINTLNSYTPGTQYITVYANAKPELTTTFKVNVDSKKPTKATLTGYPVTTYYLVDDSNYDPKYYYDFYNGTGTEEEETKQYNMGNLEVSYYYTNGDIIPADPSDYDINLDNFDLTTPSTEKQSFIAIKFKKGSIGEKYQDITIPVTVKEKENNYWKSIIFGASTSPNKKSFIEPEGDIENGGTVRIQSLGGDGKLADSNDGMAYYYTRLKVKDNFKISADLYVNDYLDKNIDENRTGQEAFGIMARDIIHLEKDPAKVTGTDKADKITVNWQDAVLDKNGEPEPLSVSTASCSNMVLAGGYSGGSWPKDPTASSYEFNSKINRINLICRYGVESWENSGINVVRTKPTTTLSETFPAVGNKYRVTMERIKGGYSATCYDYQSKETSTNYLFYDEFLNEQDAEYFYLGFFTARYADITFSNVNLLTSNPDTDRLITGVYSEVSTVTPTVTIESNSYTNDINYKLYLKTSNRSGAVASIKLNGKTVYKNESITKKMSVFPVTLEHDKTNEFTITYKPNYISEDSKNYQELTSYDQKVTTFKVIHTSAEFEKENIYVSPNASDQAKGTIDDPVSFNTAFGLQERGQTIVCLPGTYLRDDMIKILETNYGREGQVKTIAGYNAEEYGVSGYDIEEGPVIFDLQEKYSGFEVTGDYWVIKDIEVVHSVKNGKPFHLGGSHCVIENVKVHDNNDTGLQISRTNTSQDTIDEWPHDNLILNCEVWNNHDPAYSNSDGFGAKLTVGYNNVFQGCISHHNSDDGWDLFAKMATGPIAPVTLIDCVAYRNGWLLNADGTETQYPKGGWNGIKMGGDNVPVNHLLKNCKIFNNGNNGVTSNSNPEDTIRDTVSYNNSGSNFNFYSTGTKTRNYDIKGAVSYKGGGVDKVEGDYVHKDYNYLALRTKGTAENASGEAVDESFFVSLKSPVVGGFIPQDDEGVFQLNGFLELTGDTRNKIESVEGYEDTTEATTEVTTEVTTEKKGSTGAGVNSSGGGSGSVKTTTEQTTASIEEETEKTTASVEAEAEKTTKEVIVDENMVTEDTVVSNKNFFNDISSRPWAEDSINKLAGLGIVNGVATGVFEPDAYSKRADFIVMLVKVAGITETPVDNFDDVAEGNYYYNAIATAKSAGIATGYGDNTFKPNDTITRQDMMVFVARAMKYANVELNYNTDILNEYADGSQVADYAKESVAALLNAGVVSGTEAGIEPNKLITRAQMCVLLGNVYDIIIDMVESETTGLEVVDEN